MGPVPAAFLKNFLVVTGWLIAMGWLRVFWQAMRGLPRIPDLRRIAESDLPMLPETAGVPHLSVLVPACNEEANIQATLRSLLASTGLRLEIITVNDRSTDRTGEAMEAVAAEALGGPHRLIVIQNQQLPEGWLGKPHALSLAAAKATAPWLLLTDADMRFDPGALNLALRLARRESADHLVLIPTLVRESVGSAAVEAAAHALSLWAVRMWKVADPRARDFMGVGGFNLVRGDALRQIGGMKLLRMEVLEDMTLGFRIKQAGLRSMVVYGKDLVKLSWIQGWLGLMDNVRKNGFAVFRYRPGIALLAVLGLALEAIVPWTVFFAGVRGVAAGLLIHLLIFSIYALNRRRSGLSPWLALFFTPAAAVQCVALLRSMVLTLWEGGIRWRGTFYPLKDLRAHAVPWR